MKNFSDFKIKVETPAFTGDKLKVSKILNRQITVYAFKVEPSKHNSGKCLCLQIDFNQNKHIVFTGSKSLIEQINQVPKEGFPFTATIVEENERHLFT